MILRDVPCNSKYKIVSDAAKTGMSYIILISDMKLTS